MANKRQRQARHRFKEANPESFPKPEPTSAKDPSKKKKKKNNLFKRKSSDSEGRNDLKDGKRGTNRKHPLRVPGMRPGDSCFICKAQEHIAKHCPEKAQWEKNKICLLCRQRGHSLKNCPNRRDDTVDKKFCYNCGESGHALSSCPQPLQDGGTKFATCFICNQSGHLSKNCIKNTHGIYPKGGCCKICGGVTHLAKDCPNKGSRESSAGEARRTYLNMRGQPGGQVTKFTNGDDLDDDFTADDTHSNKKIKFVSGDDLGDDFVADDSCSSKKTKSAENVSDQDPKSMGVKPSKRKQLKVVNFAG